MKKIPLIIIIVVVIAIFSLTMIKDKNNPSGIKAIVYKSPDCGCCANHISYLENKGFDIETKATYDMSSIKLKYNIPGNLDSCHTMIIDNYFVEGHIPIEAINKLLEERPDILGISLPDMPTGSPGMPGIKQGSFVIYSITKDGAQNEFMRL